MKIQITMKNPDCISDAIDRAVELAVDEREAEQLGRVERESAIKDKVEELEDAIKPWVKYNEYITIEIDTEANTAIVLPV